MNDLEEISEILKLAGASDVGFCSYASLGAEMNGERREKAHRLCPDPAGVIVCAFPYLAEEEPGNISLYARGEDYHAAITRRLESAKAELEALCEKRSFAVLTDVSPLPERRAAYYAGLGIIGKNGLVYCPPYGSYIFLACILTDMELKDSPSPAPECMDCGKCRSACPTGALCGRKDSLCLSAISQKRGELSPSESLWIKEADMVWGCDICQRACPMNKNAAATYLHEFLGTDILPLKSSLALEEIEGMSDGEFRRKYRDRAFAWRGIKPLLRNLGLKRE